MALPNPQRTEPEVDMVSLARMTRITVERLAPFCQMRLLPENPIVPLVQKINTKVLGLLHAVDTTMLIAQIGYKLSNDAANFCDPFAPLNDNPTPPGFSTLETLQTMAAHGHGHCQRTNESLRSVQQEIFKIAASTKDDETVVLVPPDPHQPATRQITLKEVGTDLVANLNLLNRFSRNTLELMSWWEWLEEELLSPNSILIPSTKERRDAELYARWSKIKSGYLDYYNTIRIVYTRYPQLLTTSSSAWQSISSVPPPPSAPGSSWDGSFQDLGAAFDEAIATEAKARSRNTTPEDKKLKGAEKIKSIARVRKTLVRKLRILRLLKNGETAGDTGEKEAVDGGLTSQGPTVTLSNHQEQEEPGRVSAQVTATEAPPSQEPMLRPESETPPGEKRPRADCEQPHARSASPPLAAQPNTRTSKLLNRILAILACHKSGEITD